MLIRNASRAELDAAMAQVNSIFGGNVEFNRLDDVSNSAGFRFQITLRVKDSKGPGARRSVRGRRTVSACWHAHKVFFDSLPEDSEIVTTGGGQRRVVKPGDDYLDWTEGSPYYGYTYASDLCECWDIQVPDPSGSGMAYLGDLVG